MATIPEFERKVREIISKKPVQTDPSLGRSPNERSIKQLLEFGIAVIDKPAGPSSYVVCQRTGKILGARKCGHSGTLDPAVTGVLPVGLGRATRLLNILLCGGKEYVCTMRVHRHVEDEKLSTVFEQFLGKIKQTPPVRSRVKRVTREREIYYLETLEKHNQNIWFRVGCEGGTYIRKLAHDMGQKLGIGAHMVKLRRTAAACFSENQAHSLQELSQAVNRWKNNHEEEPLRKLILPAEQAVKHLRNIWIEDDAVFSICHGHKLGMPGVVKLESGISSGDIINIMTLKDELIATGQAQMSSQQMKEKKKGIAAKVKKVFMPAETYSTR